VGKPLNRNRFTWSAGPPPPKERPAAGPLRPCPRSSSRTEVPPARPRASLETGFPPVYAGRL